MTPGGGSTRGEHRGLGDSEGSGRGAGPPGLPPARTGRCPSEQQAAWEVEAGRCLEGRGGVERLTALGRKAGEGARPESVRSCCLPEEGSRTCPTASLPSRVASTPPHLRPWPSCRARHG